jgi:hypothetical protein
MEDLAERVGITSACLTEAIEPFGYAQNSSKMVVIPILTGPGSYTDLRSINSQKRRGMESPGGFIGKIADNARSLGAWITQYGSFSHERKKRLAAIRAAHSEVGCQLVQCLPYRYKRTLMICHIQNRALSAIEAFVPADADYAALDLAIASAGRLALAGKACTRNSENEVIDSMNTAEVLAHWKIVGCAIEARLRRLHWYQAMARHMANNLQVITAIFGVSTMELNHGFGNDTNISESYGIGVDPNPWVRQFFGDICFIGQIEPGADLLEQMRGEYARIFTWGEIRDRFLEIDFKELRSKACSSCHPPPWL